MLGDQGNSMLSFIRDYLESRIVLLKSIKVGEVQGCVYICTDDKQQEKSLSQEEIPERIAASEKLETVFLVSLCSADIETCQLVTSCIALLCEESQVDDKTFDPSKSTSAQMRNLEVYQELSSRNFRFTGLVAFQKRVRALLRQMKYPSTGILKAWEVVFNKWFELSKRLSSARPADVLDERSLVEWRNYSGFLASLAGSCISEQSAAVEESGLVGLKWIDRPSQNSYDDTLLDRYLTQSIHLLACDNVRIREATREVLSNEVSHSLYFPLFKTLESELESLFDEAHDAAARILDNRANFAEQAAALLKTVVERLGSPAEMGATLPIDIGVLTLNFAKFLNHMNDSGNILRIKIKVCQLCEVVTRKKELLNLRHDVRIRNQLLEIMFGWIARPHSSGFEANSSIPGSRGDEVQRLQKDLDKASLKVLADLTYRLPLQPADGQSDADTSDLKSQMFHAYFNRFLSLLSIDNADLVRNEALSASSVRDEILSTPDLAIVALSNLLSANIDVGLKHSLGIGYHEDLEIRTAFVKVLCNILAQGTEFNSLSDVAVNEKYDELVEVCISLRVQNNS
jgi:neurofibromin 1